MICERQDQADRAAWAFLTQLGPPAQSTLSQVPFHPGLSVELCTGASIRPQAGAVDARVTQAQKQSPSGSPSPHSPALCCSAHTKNAHIHI